MLLSHRNVLFWFLFFLLLLTRWFSVTHPRHAFKRKRSQYLLFIRIGRQCENVNDGVALKTCDSYSCVWCSENVPVKQIVNRKEFLFIHTAYSPNYVSQDHDSSFPLPTKKPYLLRWFVVWSVWTGQVFNRYRKMFIFTKEKKKGSKSVISHLFKECSLHSVSQTLGLVTSHNTQKTNRSVKRRDLARKSKVTESWDPW